MRRGLALLGTTVVGLIAAWLSLPVWAAESKPVSVNDDFFRPRELEVFAGTTVVWTHDGLKPHDVTADDGSFASHANCDGLPSNCMRSGQQFEHTFTVPGRFGYHCTLHGSPGKDMAGTIVVTGELPTSTSSSTSTTVGGSTTTRRTTPIPPGPTGPTFTVPGGGIPPVLPPDSVPPNLPGSVTDPTPLQVGPLQAGPGELTDDIVIDEAAEERPWVPATAAFLLLSAAALGAMVTARRTLGEGTPPLPPA